MSSIEPEQLADAFFIVLFLLLAIFGETSPPAVGDVIIEL